MRKPEPTSSLYVDTSRARIEFARKLNASTGKEHVHATNVVRAVMSAELACSNQIDYADSGVCRGLRFLPNDLVQTLPDGARQTDLFPHGEMGHTS